MYHIYLALKYCSCDTCENILKSIYIKKEILETKFMSKIHSERVKWGK